MANLFVAEVLRYLPLEGAYLSNGLSFPLLDQPLK